MLWPTLIVRVTRSCGASMMLTLFASLWVTRISRLSTASS
jgi:hypothetical protein